MVSGCMAHGGDDAGSVCDHTGMDLGIQIYLFQNLPSKESAGNLWRQRSGRSDSQNEFT